MFDKFCILKHVNIINNEYKVFQFISTSNDFRIYLSQHKRSGKFIVLVLVSNRSSNRYSTLRFLISSIADGF